MGLIDFWGLYAALAAGLVMPAVTVAAYTPLHSGRWHGYGMGDWTSDASPDVQSIVWRPVAAAVHLSMDAVKADATEAASATEPTLSHNTTMVSRTL